MCPQLKDFTSFFLQNVYNIWNVWHIENICSPQLLLGVLLHKLPHAFRSAGSHLLSHLCSYGHRAETKTNNAYTQIIDIDIGVGH